jgi:hypothetical protein
MNKTAPLSFAILVTSLLAGCALPPPTASGAIKEARSQVSFDIEVPLRKAYRTTHLLRGRWIADYWGPVYC